MTTANKILDDLRAWIAGQRWALNGRTFPGSTWGDTNHSHDAVVYGQHEILNDLWLWQEKQDKTLNRFYHHSNHTTMSNFKIRAEVAQVIGDLSAAVRNYTPEKGSDVHDWIVQLTMNDEYHAALETMPELAREALELIRKGQELIVTE